MKKLIPLLVLLGIVYNVKAQLTVADDNNVGIGVTNPVSKLAIGENGNTYSTFYVENNITTSSQRAAQFYKSASGDNGGDYSFAVLGNIAHNGGNKLAGGWFQAHTSNGYESNYKTFGVRSIAGNGYDGMNYSVYAYLYGTRDGAAILGTTSSSEPDVPGKFAGYFVGNVHVIGNITYSGTCNQSSDIRLKKNIRPLDDENVNQIDNLKTLTAIKYIRKTPAELNLFDPSVIDTMKVDPRTIEYTEDIYTRERIGLSAQEVQAVYPELVQENSDGFLSLDYVGLVPVIIEALKDQDITINSQTQTIEEMDQSLSLQDSTLQQLNEELQLQIQTSAELNNTILKQGDTIRIQSQAIEMMDQTISLQNGILQEQENTILALDQSLQAQASKIEDLVTEIEEIKKSISTK
jgi:uncharacterized protein YfkK (UPF0435 family)